MNMHSETGPREEPLLVICALHSHLKAFPKTCSAISFNLSLMAISTGESLWLFPWVIRSDAACEIDQVDMK